MEDKEEASVDPQKEAQRTAQFRYELLAIQHAAAYRSYEVRRELLRLRDDQLRAQKQSHDEGMRTVLAIMVSVWAPTLIPDSCPWWGSLIVLVVLVSGYLLWHAGGVSSSNRALSDRSEDVAENEAGLYRDMRFHQVYQAAVNYGNARRSKSHQGLAESWIDSLRHERRKLRSTSADTHFDGFDRDREKMLDACATYIKAHRRWVTRRRQAEEEGGQGDCPS